MNDNEGDGVANDTDDSNDGEENALQDPGDHKQLLFTKVPQRIILSSVVHSEIWTLFDHLAM